MQQVFQFQPAQNFDMAEMKAEIERQASEFVQSELSKKQALLQSQFDDAVIQKTMEMSGQQLS